MPSLPRPPGLIQRYREELQARHYARLPHPPGGGLARERFHPEPGAFRFVVSLPGAAGE
jgi:hypothetical protein